MRRMLVVFPMNEDMPCVHAWCEDTTETLCDKIDKWGGWNPKALSVKFYHGDVRSLRFSDNYMNCGYWTVCLTRDEYYWHRLSDRKKKEIESNIRMKIRNSI